MYVESEDLPISDLTQDMQNPAILVQLRDIVTGPALFGTDDVGRDVNKKNDLQLGY